MGHEWGSNVYTIVRHENRGRTQAGEIKRGNNGSAAGIGGMEQKPER